jgi:zinc protease
MTRLGRALVLASAVLLLSSAAAPTTIPRPAKFDYTMTTLPNGLQCVFLEDHSTPIVHLAIWYHVGSKDERPGRTGFAHLFEHLMFKGSKNVGPDEHPSTITSVGGQSNAFTEEDSTVFWETVPAHYLPRVLWLEADRMASLDITDDKFANEREVVKEERRMRIDNQPYGRLEELLYARAFTVHPYKHQTIGSLADLEAATLRDVREFHDTYYVPNNAALVLTGDFDTKHAQDLVMKYVGRVPRGRPVVRDIPREPEHAAETRFTVEQDWPLPAVAVAYHITYDGHPDSYPLHILAKVLADGDSSRIYRSVVHDQQLALTTFGEAKLVEHPNLFFAMAIVQAGHTPDDVLQALTAQVDRLKTELVTPAELDRAKRQFARDYILGRETLQQRALHLGHAVVIHNDIKTADGEFDLLQSVTAADVQRVARTYFTPGSRTVMTVLPKHAGGAHQ